MDLSGLGEANHLGSDVFLVGKTFNCSLKHTASLRANIPTTQRAAGWN